MPVLPLKADLTSSGEVDFSATPARTGPVEFGLLAEIRRQIHAARNAQEVWRASGLSPRIAWLRELRARIATHAGALASASAAARQRPQAESLTAEVMPLAEAARFLERHAARILAPQRLGWRGRPAWLAGVSAEIHREPHGLVLVIGPSNYPLFLPCVQALQALVAGNAVLLKPGRGGSAAAREFARLAADAGLDARLLTVLPEEPDAAQAAMAVGVDRVVLTGSEQTGRAVLRALAETLTPATMELSGVDPVVVRSDADVALTARAIAFGLRLNAGATCIAPRRIFVHAALAGALVEGLRESLARNPRGGAAVRFPAELGQAIQTALREGARVAAAENAGTLDTGPLVLEVSATSGLLTSTWFAALAVMVRVSDDEEAVRLANASPHALGASIFSRDTGSARALAARLNAGVVTINDLIVPTADPRLPFGGRGRSGFGVTRGAEGLLEMTVPKTVQVRSGRWRPHLDPPRAEDAALFDAFLRLGHGRGWRGRWRALRDLVRAASSRK